MYLPVVQRLTENGIYLSCPYKFHKIGVLPRYIHIQKVRQSLGMTSKVNVKEHSELSRVHGAKFNHAIA